MPATGFPVDSDVEALLGRFPEALKKVNAELLAAERRAASLIKNGKDIPLDELKRIDRLKANQATYAEKVAQQKAVKEQANKVIREIMGNPTGSGEANAAAATAGGGLRILGRLNVDEAAELKELAKKSKGEQPFFKRLADALNVHNPHGSIRAWLKGDPSTGNVGKLMKKLGGDLIGKTDEETNANIANAAGRIFLISRAAQLVADKLLDKGKQRELAMKVMKQVADERWKIAREYRFSSGSQGQLDEAYKLEQEKAFEKQFRPNSLNPLSPLKTLMLDGDVEGLRASTQNTILKGQLFKKSFGLTQDQLDKFNMDAASDPTIGRRIYDRVLAGGAMSVIGHMLKGMFTNQNQIEYAQEVNKRKQELMDNAYNERAKAAERYYEMDPNRIVARADNDRRLAVVNQRNLERITDWNQW